MTALAPTTPSETEDETRPRGGGIKWYDVAPIASIHVLCLGVLWVGWSWVAVAVALLLVALRMFVITAFYHRYFSHRTFRTHRVTQFLAAVAGTTCAQRGPLWWAAHHRDHHRRSDRPSDIHSPQQYGFLWSHLGWFLSRDGIAARYGAVPDFTRYPELMWVERLQLFGPVVLAGAMFGLGAALEAWVPAWGTDGLQMMIWGFAVSTTLLYHFTFTINSLAHQWGSRRFETRDDSRNNFWLALITLGEGWHNNHHYFPGSVRQGFYRWELDVTYYVLWLMAKLGLVWDLRGVPQRVYAEAARQREEGGRS